MASSLACGVKNRDGWQKLAAKPLVQPVDLAARSDSFMSLEIASRATSNCIPDGTISRS
jgi:hypothetical protein